MIRKIIPYINTPAKIKLVSRCSILSYIIVYLTGIYTLFTYVYGPNDDFQQMFIVAAFQGIIKYTM